LVFEVPYCEYENYLPFFNADVFPQAWIESTYKHRCAKIIVDDAIDPHIFLLLYPYHAFISGDPNSSSVHEILDLIPEETQMNLESDKWLPTINEHDFPGILRPKRRFRLNHEGIMKYGIACLKKPLPDGYVVRRVDRETAEQLPAILGDYIPLFFGNLDNFLEKGIAFCVKHGNNPISMAGSCIPYVKKLDVQITTVDSSECRRKGFGTAAAIALIEYCLNNAIEPHWNAANEPSVRMALKLGYTNPEEYYVYEWISK